MKTFATPLESKVKICTSTTSLLLIIETPKTHLFFCTEENLKTLCHCSANYGPNCNYVI